MYTRLNLVVTGRDEGHLRHHSLLLSSANLDLQLGSALVQTILHISHGYVLLCRGRGASGSHVADQLSICEDLSTLAGGGTLDDQTNTTSAHTVLELILDLGSTQESALDTATLADGPGKTGLDGGDGIIQIVAVEAETGLKSQTVTGTESGQLHARVGDQQPGELDSIAVGDRDLKHDHSISRVKS